MAFVPPDRTAYYNSRHASIPQRSYLENERNQGLIPVNYYSTISHSSNAPNSNTEPVSLQDSTFDEKISNSSVQDFSQSPETQRYSTVSGKAPELYVAETAEPNFPQFHETSAIQQDFLRRYNCENLDASQFGGDGKLTVSHKTGSKVIIKKVQKGPSHASADVEREIAVLSAVQSPSFLALLEYLELNDAIWTVHDYRPRRTIADLVRERGPMPAELIKSVMNDLFAGLASLMLGGYAHLRICPDTICIDDNDQCIITDFQYACEYGKERIGDLYAPVSERHSKDIYAAPEIFAGGMYNARKAVIWSCGILLYFMVTGQTEKLSNIDHPIFGSPIPTTSGDPTAASSTTVTTTNGKSSTRRFSVANAQSKIIAQSRIINYPTNRFAIPDYARWIIPKMLVHDPMRRAELLEVASRVPKNYGERALRPLMELCWLDYKHNVGPNADLHFGGSSPKGSRASSIYSMASSAFSNPFGGLLSKGHNRRQSAPVVDSRYRGYYAAQRSAQGGSVAGRTGGW